MAVFQNGAIINTVGIKNQNFSCKTAIFVRGGHVYESQIQYSGNKINQYAVQNRSAAIGDVIRLEEVLMTDEIKLVLEQIYRNNANKIAVLLTLTDGSFKGNVVLGKNPEWAPGTMQTIEFVVDGDNLVSKI
jgi:hypothetical protein